MGSVSPQGYKSGAGNPGGTKEGSRHLSLDSSFAPLSTGAKGRMGMNKACGLRSFEGGCLGLLSGVSQSRWKLTHRVTAAGGN